MSEQSRPHPSVCIIIVSHNFEPWIHRCLPSVEASLLPATVMVIDNGSGDATCQIIRNNYPGVELIETHENLGFGRANNIGIQLAVERGFDYLFLLNQDAWIEPDTLVKLVDAAEKNSAYGILSPVHLNGKGDATDFGFSEYTGLKNREEVAQLTEEVTPYPFINAAMWLIPVRVIRETGPFAPLFPHYGEDRNLVLRLQKRGYRVGLVKSAFGYHDREDRPVSRKQSFDAEYVYFLTEAVNPFYSPPKAIAYSLLAALKKAWKALLSGNGADCFAYLKVAFRLAGKCRSIHRTRMETNATRR
ncbi:MAG TPA: glycosyltransferase family 2 protein [Porphyromonadaceae bacterium]|nr:glycosyltransferase family 2 protein [Porphyromonadaceae bacterium]